MIQAVVRVSTVISQGLGPGAGVRHICISSPAFSLNRVSMFSVQFPVVEVVDECAVSKAQLVGVMVDGGVHILPFVQARL